MKALSIAALCVLLSTPSRSLRAQSSPVAVANPSQTEAVNANLDRLKKEVSTRPDWIEGSWNLGTAAYDANRFDLAIPSLKRVVQAQPQLGIAWDLLGLSQFELKQFTEARASLERAIALGSIDDPEVEAVAAYHLALLRLRDADFDGADAILRKNFGESPNPQAQFALGLAAMRIALLPSEVDPSREALVLQIGTASAAGDKGLVSFANLAAANDSLPMLHFAFGAALLRAGRVDEAIQQLRLETKLSPQNPVAWKALSQAEQKTGHQREADAAAANEARHKSQETACEERTKKLFAAQGAVASENALADGMRAYGSEEYATARLKLTAWVASHPTDGTAWAVLGLSEYKLSDYGNARVHLERGVSLGLQADAHAVATARYTLGVLLLQAGEFERAATELNAARTLDSSRGEIGDALGCVLLRRTTLPGSASDALTSVAGKIEVMLLESRYDEAFPAFRAMLARYPQQPNLHWAFGTALLALSEYDKALEQMQEEQRITPNSALPYSGLALIALRQHKPTEAIESAQRAVALAPDSAEPHYLLGRALLESGASISKAVDELQRAAQVNPNSPEVHFTLAKAYSRDSKPEQAVREREIFAHLNEVKQAQVSGNTDQTYAGPRQAEVLSTSPNQSIQH